MPTTIRTRCPAKINLALSVGAPADNGYHPIASWMVTVDLFDDLLLERLDDDDQSRYTIGWADDAPQPTTIDWPTGSDLIVRAHRLLEAHVGGRLPIRATLTKRIPVGAGLAGGSSDGAGMLKAIDRLFDLKLGDASLTAMASELGSDLAFFFSTGSAIITGYGERLEPGPPMGSADPLHLALIMPPLHCNTGAVYRAFDERRPDARVDEADVRAAAGPPLAPFNDLAAPACDVEPRLATLRRSIADATGRPVHITGSGAAMFIVTDDAADAEAMAKAARSVDAGLAARAVSTIAPPT